MPYIIHILINFIYLLKIYEKITIEFTKTDSTSNNIQYVTIFEYSNRNSTTELEKKGISLSFSSSKNSFSTSYSVNKPLYNYVAFEMLPCNTMPNVNIITSITTYVYYEYDLTSEESKFISTMYTSGIYKFYISVEYAQIVDIEFIKVIHHIPLINI